MCRQFEPDRGSQKKTNVALVFFAVLVHFGENCISSENGTFSLWLYATSSDRGSQKDSEICLTAVSLFFAFLGLFKPFFDCYDKFWIMRNQKRRD